MLNLEFPQNPDNPDAGLLLAQDVATRWNSTYLMLQRALLVKDALNMVLAKPYWKQKYNIEVNKKQWDLIEKVVLVLKDFAEVTDRLSYSSACVSEVCL